MPAVRGGMVTGDGKRQQGLAVFFYKASAFHRGKGIGRAAIGVNGKMLKGNPGQTGNGVGVGRRQAVRLGKHAVMRAIGRLIVQIRLMKGGKGIAVFRPHQRKGVVIRMKGGIQRGKPLVIAELAVLLGDFERHLLIQPLGYQPQVSRKKRNPAVLSVCLSRVTSTFTVRE